MTETSCREKDAPLLKTHNEGISIILTIHSDDCYYERTAEVSTV